MLYTARQVTESLDCSPQMAGKYFQALEKITKTKIKTHGRQGRQFDSMTRDVLVSARDIVRSNNGVTVEDAVKRALSLSQVPVAVDLGIANPAVDLAAVDSTLRTALKDEVTTPLITEMQALRAEIAALRGEVRGNRQTTSTRPVVFGAEEWATDLLEAPRQIENPGREENHGYLVRFALWVEQRIRGK